MPIEENEDLALSTQEKTVLISCAALVATYVGFAINSRRLLKKSLQESNEMYKETSEKLNEAIDSVKRKVTDN